MKLPAIVPMEPISTKHFLSGHEWISQVKWDGVRIITYYDGDSVRIKNRRLNDRTIQYPELLDIGKYCSANSVILDGEVIALEEGKPSFYQVMKRDRLRKESNVASVSKVIPIVYMIFDVLYINNTWVTDRPLYKRQEMLREIITEGEQIQLVENHSDALALFQAVSELGLEGIIMKDLNSTYLVKGKDARWQKKKVLKDLIAVVGGVTFRSTYVNALILGLYDQSGQLHYIGHAGSGKLTQKDWLALTQQANQLRLEKSPFVNQPDRKEGAMWLSPQLTVKIEYLEWTKSGTLRQPSIQSFVSMDPKQCTFDQL